MVYDFAKQDKNCYFDEPEFLTLHKFKFFIKMIFLRIFHEKSFLLLLFLCTSLFAEEDEEWEIVDALDYDLSTEVVQNDSKAHFQPTTDFRIPLKVNPISGEYSEDAIDLVVAGAQPLSLRRYQKRSFWNI